MSQVIYRLRIVRAITDILEKIEKAANRSDRNLEDITLIAVTKSHPISAILEILKFEIFDLGENRVPELIAKQESVPDERIRWHMIGHLQSRKVPAVLGSTQLIHSIDSLKLAKRLSNKAVEAGMREQVLLQINASRESTKGGFIVPDMDEDLYSALNLPGLKVAGLMTMAPLTEDGIVMRNTFKSVRELQQKLIDSGLLAGKVLSMGMSNDFEIAIEEGSTMVRLGTALFGKPA
jgi:pyridoxal phosphate enzyme (YggS family)